MVAPYPEGPSLTVFSHPKDPGVQLDGAVELGQVVVVRLQQLGEKATRLFTKQSRGGWDQQVGGVGSGGVNWPLGWSHSKAAGSR